MPTQRNGFRPDLETLEDRTLLDAQVTAVVKGGVLKITGTDSTDTILVKYLGGTIEVDVSQVTVTPGQTTTTSGGLILDDAVFTKSTTAIGTFGKVKKIEIKGLGGDDVIKVDSLLPPLKDGVFVDGGTGLDNLTGVAGRDQLVGGSESDRINVLINLGYLIKSEGDTPLVPRKLLGAQGTDTYDVQLDKASFGADFVAPVIAQVQKSLKFLKPMLSKLNRNIPLLSDLSAKVGQGPITWGDFIDQVTGGDFSDFLDTYNEISNLSVGSFSGTVDLGEFTVTGGDPILSEQVNVFKQFADGGLTNHLEDLGFHFKFLEDVTQAVRFILNPNQTMTLFEYDLPDLNVSINVVESYPIPTPWPGVNAQVDLGGGLDVSAGATVGFDTKGFKTGDWKDGFYVTGAFCEIDPSVTVEGGIYIGVTGLVNLAGVAAKGQLGGRIYFKLPGKYRPNSDGSISENEVFGSPSIKYRASVVVKYNEFLADVASGNIAGALGGLVSGITSGGTSLGKLKEKEIFKLAEGTLDF